MALAAAIGVAAPAAAEAGPPAGRDPGSLGVRLLDVPASAAADPRARSYIVDAMAPGATIERRVQISNTTSSRMAVDVYAAAASITDGAFVVADGNTANDLSSWTTPSEDRVQVAAGGAVDVAVTVAVPPTAAPGEQYAVIWAATAGPASGDVLAINRVGVRMYVAVLGDNPLPSAFVIDSMTAERTGDGHGLVRVAVRNTGGRAVDLSGELTMSAVGAAVSAGPYQVTSGTTIAPGQSGTVVVEVTDDVADGPWDAVVHLSSGLVTGSYEGQLTFPARTGAGPIAVAPAPAVLGDAGTPWWQIALPAIVLAAAVVLLVLLRRRRRARRALATSARHSGSRP